MKELVLAVDKRCENAKRSRKNGFIPGIVYGKGCETIPVKFNKTDFEKVLKLKGERSKILVLLSDEEYLGIIKEVSRDLATNEIIHVDIQLVSKDEIVNWTIPVVYTGKNNLKSKGLYLQMHLNEVEVTAKAVEIPDVIKFDVSNKNFGDNIKIKDLELSSEIKTLKEKEAVMATITS